MIVKGKWKLHSGLFGAEWMLSFIWRCIQAVCCLSRLQCGSIDASSFPSNNTRPRTTFVLYPSLPSVPSTMTRTQDPILPQPNLQGEHKKPGESGVLPPSHQVPPLQFEVSLVPSLHHHQAGIGGSFSGHVLITCEGWNHWPAVENQTHLRGMGEMIEWKEEWGSSREGILWRNNCWPILLRCSPYLYRLPVVNFDDVKAETVDSFSRGHEDTPRWIEMAANIY